MGHGEHRDDREWKALLRANTPEPPYDDVDWSALHARITTRTRPLVQRAPASWWQHVAGWSLRGVPAAAAAAALVLLVVSDVVRPPSAAIADFHTIEEELAAAMPDEGMPFLDEGGDMTDALLFYGTE